MDRFLNGKSKIDDRKINLKDRSKSSIIFIKINFVHIDHAKNISTGQIFDFCLLFLAFLSTSYVLSRT